MNPLQALASLSGGSSKLYVDDVFSAFTYTGNGSTQTITNGIDLAGKGGLVWTKQRNSSNNNHLATTAQGVGKSLASNNTATEQSQADQVTSFNSNGYSLGADATQWEVNKSAQTYVSWTFRKAPKFFDVVTFTSSTNTNQRVSHALGQAPGMILVKRTDAVDSWWVYHTSQGHTKYLSLNQTAAATTPATAPWGTSAPTSTDFGVNVGSFLTNSATHVAYLFAHDTGTDGIVQCGSFTTDGGGVGPFVSLGWEPQFVLYKDKNYVSGTGGDWNIVDTSRGMRGYAGTLGDPMLEANTSAVEQASAGYANVTATGFYGAGSASHTYIYLAIRRPNKPPTVGTQVYNAIARTGTGAAATVTGVGFAPDLVISNCRSTGSGNLTEDRLRGATKGTVTSSSAVEITVADALTAFGMDGFSLGVDTGNYINANTRTYVHQCFKRAPGVFDVVCYTGNGVETAKSHSLGVAPQMIIMKRRDAAGDWVVYHSYNGTKYLNLNYNGAAGTWTVITATSSTTFTLSTDPSVNTDTGTYVAYLFATKTGVSYVGSYVGNGTNQTIDCGFAAGARFVMIKAASASGNWLVGDTTRGIIAGNDPSLALNTTTAEVTTLDWLDPDSSGFIVNQEGTNNANVNAVTYLVLAYA